MSLYRINAIVQRMASPGKTTRAAISWEGDSIEVLRAWPKPIREDFGVALGEMQEGRPAALPVRPMPSIAAGVFELKDADNGKWYRVVYMARHKETIYVLHCFTKNTAKTEKRDLATAAKRWKDVQRRLREEGRDEKKRRS
jgi:phage-related protein